MQVVATINSQKLTAALTAASAPARQESLESIGQLMVSQAKDNIRARTGPDGQAWPRTALTDLYGGARTWQDIAMSLNFEANGELGTLSIGSSHIAAATRHFGTVGAGGTEPDIEPVKKKALTIPVSDAASRASYNGIDARTAFPNAFFLKKDGSVAGASPIGGLGVIAHRLERGSRKGGTKKGDIEVLYVLVASVAIRPHPFMPVNAAGQIQPAGLVSEIETILINDLLKRMEDAGDSANSSN